jgi:hypothetical protein
MPISESMKKQETDFYKEYYSQLEGATIVKFLGMKEEAMTHGAFPQFTLKLKSGEKVKVEVSKDQEGNGGGFLFIGNN